MEALRLRPEASLGCSAEGAGAAAAAAAAAEVAAGSAAEEWAADASPPPPPAAAAAAAWPKDGVAALEENWEECWDAWDTECEEVARGRFTPGTATAPPPADTEALRVWLWENPPTPVPAAPPACLPGRAAEEVLLLPPSTSIPCWWWCWWWCWCWWCCWCCCPASAPGCADTAPSTRLA